jgi:signal transduction histidine kinase
MKFNWEWTKQLRKLLATDQPEPAQQAARIVAMQRDVVLPSKAGVILVVLYYYFYSGWFDDMPTTRSVVQGMLQGYFWIYVLCNVVAAALFASWRRLPPGLFQWLAFTLGLLDGLFIAGMTIVTAGFDSIVFWVFPCLILLNALSIPVAMPQIVLNLLLSLFYFGAGIVSPHIGLNETAMLQVPGRSVSSGTHTTNLSAHASSAIHSAPASENSGKPRKPFWSDEPFGDSGADAIPTEPFLLRLSVLWLLTVCCYGAQVLWERQRQADFEAGEFAARENQLHSAGRLAAEFAHQIKNPLAIISNAAYSLQRSLPEAGSRAAQQIEIIREEVSRADQVITQIMGYAQLSEGRVEKLNVAEEVGRAVAQVFPAAMNDGIKLQKKITGRFPPLFMQRGHLSEILVNVLQNAREALGEKGNVLVAAVCGPDNAIEISVRDDGPGISPDKLEQIFEAYFTTKEKGTGLGLAIVKHNLELYGATVRVESVLGKGAKFTVTFPFKSQTKPIIK